MLQFDLTADVRNKFGKGANRRLRREGLTPAILYGPKTEPLPLKIDAKSFTKVLISRQERNAVFNLEINEGSGTTKKHVIVKEIQAEPIKGSLVHTDLLEVQLEEPMEFEVSVNYLGVAKGVELGGEMHVALSTVAIKGLILDIPDSIDIDVSELNIGDRLFCKDLAIPSGMELLNDLEATCVSVTTAAKEPVEEELEAEGEEGAEGDESAEAPAAEGDAGSSEEAAS